MSTAQEIENAIRALPASERDKLLQHIPKNRNSSRPGVEDDNKQRGGLH